MKKKILFVLLAFAVLMPLAAGGKGEESGEGTYKIGVSMFNLTSEYLT